MVEGIIQAQEDPFFPKAFMKKHQMYQVGSYNTDQICITKDTSQFREGEILFVEEGDDIYNPQDSQIHRLAKDFEQFLIIAGNLAQTHQKMDENEKILEEQKEIFIKILKELHINEAYQKAWISLFF
jgi:hypothetical protein